MNIILANCPSGIKRKVRLYVKALLEREQIDCDEIYITYVNEKQIAEIHRQFFQDLSVTDCITFPIDASGNRKTGPCILGEIYICPPVAKQYAEEHGFSPEKELTLYLIHGLLHLLGYKDYTEKERRVMRKKEKEYMEYIETLEKTNAPKR